MKRCQMLAFAMLGLFVGTATAYAADWPAWRGADRTNISREQGLARTWPQGGPPLVWKVTGVGEGYSTPSIADGVIYGMGNRNGSEWVWARSATNGKELWATAIGPVRHDGAGYPGPRSTPTVDGQRLYALGINGDLVAMDIRNGRIQWRRNLPDEFDATIPNWGYAESVLVDGPFILCTPGGQKGTIAKLDKQSGTTIWATKLGDGAGYASVILAQIAGIPQYVQFTARGVISVAADDGRFLWRYDAPANGTANIATPLCEADAVFAASGYGTGGGLVNISRDGNDLDARQVYFTKAMKNHHGGLVLIDGLIFGSNDPGTLSCLDFKTGDVRWMNREPGKCSIVYVDGMIVTRSEEGLVCLVEGTGDAYHLLGKFEQPSRSELPSWPHPVVADGRLYLRDQDVLLSYHLKPAGSR